MGGRPGSECARVCVEPSERREQGRVDVDDAALPRRGERGREQAHEAGEANEIDVMSFEDPLQGVLEGFAILAEGPMVDGRW